MFVQMVFAVLGAGVSTTSRCRAPVQPEDAAIELAVGDFFRRADGISKLLHLRRAWLDEAARLSARAGGAGAGDGNRLYVRRRRAARVHQRLDRGRYEGVARLTTALV